jgi:hypothetical protein
MSHQVLYCSTFTAAFFLLSVSVAVSQSPPPLAAAWENGDENSIYAFSSISDATRYLDLNDAEIAALAVPMARWIPLQKTLESSSDQSWKSFKTEGDWTPFLNSLPKTDPVKKRWWLGELAASACRALAEKGRLKTKEVIPYLIAGLDDPCQSYTARDCYYALAALTKLYDKQQPIFESRLESHALNEWYSEWWKKNRNGDLIVDSGLRSRIDASFLTACKRIELATADVHHSLHGFKTPALSTISRTDEALRETEYFPREELSGVDLGRMGRTSWIWIGVVSKSSPITTISKWSKSDLDPASAMPVGTKEIFHKSVPNSDWQIKVYTNRVPTPDEAALVKSLSTPS